GPAPENHACAGPEAETQHGEASHCIRKELRDAVQRVTQHCTTAARIRHAGPHPHHRPLQPTSAICAKHLGTGASEHGFFEVNIFGRVPFRATAGRVAWENSDSNVNW